MRKRQCKSKNGHTRARGKQEHKRKENIQRPQDRRSLGHRQPAMLAMVLGAGDGWPS